MSGGEFFYANSKSKCLLRNKDYSSRMELCKSEKVSIKRSSISEKSWKTNFLLVRSNLYTDRYIKHWIFYQICVMIEKVNAIDLII